MKDQAHKNMLIHEQRRLHDEDMKKVHMRAKRLETRRKMDIIGKEKRDLDVHKEVTRREQKLVDFRYRNRVQRMV